MRHIYRQGDGTKVEEGEIIQFSSAETTPDAYAVPAPVQGPAPTDSADYDKLVKEIYICTQEFNGQQRQLMQDETEAQKVIELILGNTNKIIPYIKSKFTSQTTKLRKMREVQLKYKLDAQYAKIQETESLLSLLRQGLKTNNATGLNQIVNDDTNTKYMGAGI